MEDLDPDMIFELKQRSMKPREFEDDEEIKDNFNSIKVAEAIVGAKMAGPNDPAELAKNFPEVTYKVQGPVRQAEPWHLNFKGGQTL